MRAPAIASLPAIAALALVACGGGSPPPSTMGETPLRAPAAPPSALLVSLPGVAPVPRLLNAELTRGAEAICAPLVGTRLDPVSGSTFRVTVQQPGFAATRETVLRRTAGGPPDAPELALDGANNGRCDYLFRPAG